MATPRVECAECCGEGHDLDTLYWGDEYCEAGTEVDCSHWAETAQFQDKSMKFR